MKEHRLEKRIYYHDTDAGGIVYYASYLKHMEEGRAEFLRDLGVDTDEFLREGILFPVVHIDVDYKAPAKYGDIVQVVTAVEKVGNASVHFTQDIKKQDTLLAKGRVVWVCVNKDMKPKPIPEEIRRKLLR